MIINLPTRQLQQSKNISKIFTYTMAAKTTWHIDMERNYVTATLCIRRRNRHSFEVAVDFNVLSLCRVVERRKRKEAQRRSKFTTLRHYLRRM